MQSTTMNIAVFPVTALAESATNPRKRFDAKSLEELAASLPVLVPEEGPESLAFSSGTFSTPT